MVFSAMPKPLAHAPGSGLHFHISITDAQGRAVFADPQGDLGLSTAGHQFAAGLLHHADALAALCAPTVNSYKRLASSDSASGTTWSPVWKAYGDNNRTSLVRVVDGRLEWRLPDPSCNVYAAIAATLVAGLQGIDRALQPPAPVADDLYQRAQGGARLTARFAGGPARRAAGARAGHGLAPGRGRSFLCAVSCRSSGTNGLRTASTSVLGRWRVTRRLSDPVQAWCRPGADAFRYASALFLLWNAM